MALCALTWANSICKRPRLLSNFMELGKVLTVERFCLEDALRFGNIVSRRILDKVFPRQRLVPQEAFWCARVALEITRHLQGKHDASRRRPAA